MIIEVPITLDEERVKLCGYLTQLGLDNYRKFAGLMVKIDIEKIHHATCGDEVREWELTCEDAKKIGMPCYAFPHTHRICGHFIDVD